MNRRDLLKMMGAAGLTAASPTWLARRAHASQSYTGPLVVTLHAGGGWDPTMICDPKGRANENATDPVNHYFTDEITNVGSFDLAPVPRVIEFFQAYRDQILALNGVDNQTNSHETGTRYAWSGRTDPGSPALSALSASLPEDRASMAFLSHGGYDLTGGAVPITRLPNTDTVRQLAHPYLLDPDSQTSNLFTQSTQSRLQQAQLDRLARQKETSSLPREIRAMQRLREARVGDNELALLAEVLPAAEADTKLQRQAQITMACFKAGVTTSASLSAGGFDTHGNHDESHTSSLNYLFDGARYIMEEAERQGLADRILLLIGSDFGRTPWYNAGNGKDHFSITSMLMIGPGIPGNRVIGRTDERVTPRRLDPDTLKVDDDGIRITPGHIHATLRQHLGIDTPEIQAQWPTSFDSLPLF